MDIELNRDAKRIVSDWIAELNAALEVHAPERVGALFRPDADWRDIVALTRTIETVSDRTEVARRLVDSVATSGASGFAIDPERYPPRDVERAGEPCVEAILTFQTAIGTGAGIVRLKRSDCRAGAAQAWTLLTSLDLSHNEMKEIGPIVAALAGCTGLTRLDLSMTLLYFRQDTLVGLQ
jgi:putative flavoprotein involved in K+ transport